MKLSLAKRFEREALLVLVGGVAIWLLNLGHDMTRCSIMANCMYVYG